MSPFDKPKRSPDNGKVVRQPRLDPPLGPQRNSKKKPDFDPLAFLATIGEGRKFVLFPKKEKVFAQGDAADAVFCVQTGKVRLSVVSTTGKEATIRILGE